MTRKRKIVTEVTARQRQCLAGQTLFYAIGNCVLLHKKRGPLDVHACGMEDALRACKRHGNSTLQNLYSAIVEI